MQGGNVAGGLGLDREFFESVLAPQVMLYGFLGFQPTAEGFAIHPKLPADWPSLTVTRIHLHDRVLDITANHDGKISVTSHGPKEKPLIVETNPGTSVSSSDGTLLKVVNRRDE
jgi:cellobiose phosphorylase